MLEIRGRLTVTVNLVLYSKWYTYLNRLNGPWFIHKRSSIKAPTV